MSTGSKSFDGYLVPVDPKENSEKASGRSWRGDGSEKVGTTRIVPSTGDGASGDSSITALVSLGPQFSTQTLNAKNEAYRRAVATGLEKLNQNGVKNVGLVLSDSSHAGAASVGAHLSTFEFSLKTNRSSTTKSDSSPTIAPGSQLDSAGQKEWDRGVLYAQSQNLTRELMELPANMLTPTAFCKRIQKEFQSVPDTEVIVHDEEWAEAKGMNTFLSVTHGTSEPAKFLEIHYNGGAKGDQPLAFVGKGITFDSGGISIKPALDMKLMRGDMGGAATVASAALAIAKMKLPINLVVSIALTENMPGPSATKPGDIIYAMNGKTVEVDNTDAEGRLILADALHYTNTTYKPHTLIDVATLTGAMVVSLGQVFSGVFSSSDSLWQELHEAGEVEFDRFWRMPIDEEFGPQIYESNADLCNRGGIPGGSCTAALFLKAFVDGLESNDDRDPVRWAHIDIAGTMEAVRALPYQKKGMTGRGTRGLIEFARRLSTDVQ